MHEIIFKIFTRKLFLCIFSVFQAKNRKKKHKFLHFKQKYKFILIESLLKFSFRSNVPKILFYVLSFMFFMRSKCWREIIYLHNETFSYVSCYGPDIGNKKISRYESYLTIKVFHTHGWICCISCTTSFCIIFF